MVAALARNSTLALVNVKREGVAIMPNGTVVNLENELLAAHPKRPRANVALIEADSFVQYLKRFKVEGRTIIFGEATEQGGSFHALVDYHDAQRLANPTGEQVVAFTEATAPKANWGDHKVKLTLSPTPEWTRWIGANNKLIPQAEFAEFVEDNAADIVHPDAAALLDMASFLQGKKTVTFKGSRNIGNGATELCYSEQIEETSGRRDEVQRFPTHMIVKLRPFVGSASVEIPARLRFRISDSGKLSFQFLLDRPFKVIEAAFVAICTEIETELGIPVMLGTAAVVQPQNVTGA